ASLCLLGGIGCGGRKTYPVEGVVAWPDGKPATELAGYRVTFEAEEPKVGPNGVVQRHGTFCLGTAPSEAGAGPGQPPVALPPPHPLHEVDAPRPKAKIPLRYSDLSASGLTVEVKRETNKVTLTVERPGR